MAFSLKNIRCLIVGNDAETHVGRYFKSAAAELGMDVLFLNGASAFSRFDFINKIFWYLFGQRPIFLNSFSKKVLDVALQSRRDFILVTGIAPVSAQTLKNLEEQKMKTINYLTDDPFNPAHRAAWFLEAIKNYSMIASQRNGNIQELRAWGCSNVFFLPFAYDARTHYLEPQQNDGQDQPDVVFIGGADKDRIPYFQHLAAEGFKLALYGGYWDRYPDLKQFYQGFADSETSRNAISRGKVSLCLVRDANRDDNSMRTFEVAAMGGCMLIQDTPYHRDLFGKDMDAVAYFSDKNEMVSKLKVLLSNHDLRNQMRVKTLTLIHDGKHTYVDRLRKIFEFVYE